MGNMELPGKCRFAGRCVGLLPEELRKDNCTQSLGGGDVSANYRVWVETILPGGCAGWRAGVSPHGAQGSRRRSQRTGSFLVPGRDDESSLWSSQKEIGSQMPTLTLCQLAAGAPLSRLPSQACDRCRRNKTRCDRLPVCKSCRKSGAACSYDATPRRRGPRPRKMSAHNRTDGTADRGETATPPQPEADDGESPAFSTLLGPPGQPGYEPDPYCGAQGLIEAQSGLGSLSSTTSASSLHSSSSQSNGAPETPHVAGIMGIMADPLSDGACVVEARGPSPAGGRAPGMNDTIRVPAANTPIFQDDDLGEARIPAWMETSAAAAQLPRSVFLPYVELFLERLYPVFPVLERHTILAALQDPPLDPLLPSFYCFLTALSAATIVQLNVTGPLSGFDGSQGSGATMPLFCSAELFVAESLRTRQDGDFIECADEYTILASFFLFGYYGNMERSRAAWYYLREAIGFALSLGFDDPDTYLGLDTATKQRRQRLFWLLFVTERY